MSHVSETSNCNISQTKLAISELILTKQCNGHPFLYLETFLQIFHYGNVSQEIFTDGSLSDYLHTRTQRVVAEGAASSWSPVTSGVPQGSFLGPILFLLFINDFPDVIPESTSTGLYADDTKLYREISTLEDCSQLQEALSCADVWSKDNNINFDPSKCKILTFSCVKHLFFSITFWDHPN